MSNIKVSICCLAYNHEPYIKQCLEGFILQKCNFSFEVLIHEDASTDRTASILKEYEAKYPDIIKPIYQTQNQYSKGIKPTFEYNFPRAQGKYIALCEGDDYWTDPLKLQKQVDFLEENEEYSMCFHNRQILDLSGNLYLKSLFKDSCRINQEDMISTFTPTLTIMFRNFEDTKALSSIKIFAGDFLLRSFLSTKGPAYFMDFCGAVYRQHQGGIYTSKSRIDQLKLSYASQTSVLKSLNNINIKDIHFTMCITILSLLIYDIKEIKLINTLRNSYKLIFHFFNSKRKFFLLKILIANIFKLRFN